MYTLMIRDGEPSATEAYPNSHKGCYMVLLAQCAGYFVSKNDTLTDDEFIRAARLDVYDLWSRTKSI